MAIHLARFVLLFTFFVVNEGFLLDSSLQRNTTLNGLNQYLTTEDKIKIERSLEEQHQLIEQQHRDLLEFKSEQTKTMTTLIAQLQQKLDQLDKHTHNSSLNNASCQQLVTDNQILKNQVHSLGNASHQLKFQLNLARSKITEIQTKTTSLEREIQTMDSYFRSEIATMKITHGVLNGPNQPKNFVAVMARVQDKTFYTEDKITYRDIQTSVGLTDQATFKSTGIFTCTFPGVYLFSCVLMSNTTDAYFTAVRKTPHPLGYDVITNLYLGPLTSRFREVSGVFVIQLQLGDTLYVTSQKSQYIYYESLVTIVKLD